MLFTTVLGSQTKVFMSSTCPHEIPAFDTLDSRIPRMPAFYQRKLTIEVQANILNTVDTYADYTLQETTVGA